MTKRQFILSIIAAPFILLGCSFVGLLVYDQDPIFWPKASFDKRAWVEAKEGSRYVFVKDLIGSGRLNQLTRQQVHELLGKPSYDNGGDEISYVVLEDRSIYILDVRLGATNGTWAVSSAFIRPI